MEETKVTEDDAISTTRKRKNPFHVQLTKEEKERRQKKRARIVVRNISFKTKEEDLRKHFEQWGTLEEVNLLKRPDGKLVGCAFLQYEAINQATKAILKGNGNDLLGRPIFVDWAVGKTEFQTKQQSEEIKTEKIKKGDKSQIEKSETTESQEETIKEDNDELEDDSDDSSDESESGAKGDSTGSEDKVIDKDDNEDMDIKPVKKRKISNDVQEGCTIFIKNLHFDATEDDLRQLCRKYGPVSYAIINREPVSGHSRGTAFVKFKAKESADLCLQAGTELSLMDQVLEPMIALSKEEIKKGIESKSNENKKDSRNLYLVREGLIMSGSKAAEGVSASDMAKRHKLEQVKAQVLKNLNRFVSRNRLSIHNLPLSYDNEKLKKMAITHTELMPHECRVMRENKITREHPQGKSKGFGFLSFNTHQDALTALRKLNNNPKIFGAQHRPIVAFSIEDRAVHKLKENRERKSKLNNPTYKEKLERRKEMRMEKIKGKIRDSSGKLSMSKNIKSRQQHLNTLKDKPVKKSKKDDDVVNPESFKDYVGATAKASAPTRLRSNKKIKEQSKEHMKRVKTEKRKEKQRKIKQIHLAERKEIIRPKQGRKRERDDLTPLVNKYKQMINSRANEGSVGNPTNTAKKPKRTKWYAD